MRTVLPRSATRKKRPRAPSDPTATTRAIAYVLFKGGHGASAHRGRFRRCPSSPTIPRRKVRTQTMKMSPWTMVNHDPSWAR